MRRWLCACGLLVIGCAAAVRTEPRVGMVNREEPAATRSAVSQAGGRDVLNVSPTVAVSGGGGVMMLAAGGFLLAWRRSRRTLRTIVSSIEDLGTAQSRPVKRQVLRGALASGVADYLHGMVKKNNNA